jgi:hypothetical protein
MMFSFGEGDFCTEMRSLTKRKGGFPLDAPTKAARWIGALQPFANGLASCRQRKGRSD